MVEKFAFFDPVETAPGVYDREYNAEQFTDYFKSLITTGVMAGTDNELAVETDYSSMQSKLSSGVAFVQGRYYGNTESLTHMHDTEVLGRDRIDRIVIRLDLNTEARYVKSFVKKGTASISPTPPNLTRDNFVYEISVAQVYVTGGQTYISEIIDERDNPNVCGWAGSTILPNFDDDALADLVQSLKVEEPIEVTEFGAGWRSGTGGGISPVNYYKDPFNRVYIQGMPIRDSGTISWIFNLPDGYKPRHTLFFNAISSNADSERSNIRMRIDTNGNVNVDSSGNYINGNVIEMSYSFRAED